jgi:MFS family permease
MCPSTLEAPGNPREFLVLSVSQFALAFALNFMFVFLPFYVQAISHWDEAGTLRWTGLIVGAASAMAVFGSAVWGNLTDRFSPKALFIRGLLSHAILVAVMAFVTDLYLLLAIQFIRGFLGGISTIGLIIITAISREEELARRMGTYQSALTLGQILAPPLGAMAAMAFGYRGAFLVSSLMLFGVTAFAWLGLSPVPPQARRRAADSLRRGRPWLVWAVSFAGTMQIVFLPSILPTILQGFGVPEATRVATAGGIVFAYGASAAAGSYGISRLTARFPAPRLLLLAAGGASLGQLLLALGPAGPVSFTLIRMAQTACAAGIFPLVLAQVATDGRGRSLGFVNAARFAGNAAGPIVATFILAHSDLLTLCLVLAGGLAAAAGAQHLAGSVRPGERRA